MSYKIADEPVPTSLSHYAVRPNAPLLALMLCGAWLAWPWFAFNSFALGSPTKRRELTLVAIAAAGTAALAAIIVALWRADILRGTSLRFALLAVSAWKFTFAYYICALQSRTFHIYEYYGGTVRSPRVVIGTGMYLRSVLIGLIDDPVLIIIVTGFVVRAAVL